MVVGEISKKISALILILLMLGTAGEAWKREQNFIFTTDETDSQTQRKYGRRVRR